jgi:hypothetical protein
MSFDATELFIGLVAGTFGMAYFIYGKKQSRFAAMISGVLLCVYPYVVSGTVWLCVVGALLLAVPFMTDF